MNILVDFIDDGALAYAMHLLFEVRMNHTLYWPQGNEWIENGYFSRHIDFIIDRNTGYNKKWDWHFKTITFSEFLSNKDTFGALLVLGQWNDFGPYSRLIRDHAPNAKLIRHIGNPAEHLEDGRYEPGFRCSHNIITSLSFQDVYPLQIFQDGNHVFAHQEFNVEDHFRFTPAIRYNRITGFQHDLCTTTPYLPFWKPLQSILIDFEWRTHGHDGLDGDIEKGIELGKAFSETTFVLQLKNNESCGGHLTHNAFATGRPLICKKSFYNGIMLDMLVDGVTCIDIDKRSSPQENAEFIRYCSEPSRWQEMSQAVYGMFKKYCDYNTEAEDVKKFMGNLQ